MDKKELKFYESPKSETIEVELEGHILDASFKPIVWGANEEDDTLDGDE